MGLGLSFGVEICVWGWIPIALLLALIFMNIKDGELLIPGAQGIGFMALGICLFSPLSLLHSNTQPESK